MKPLFDRNRYPASHVKWPEVNHEITADSYQSLIDLKAQRNHQYRQQSALFLIIGLCLSLLAVITAFEWKFYDETSIVDLGTVSQEDFQEVLDIPVTEQPPPPPPQQKHFQLVEIPDEVIVEELDLTIDVEVSDETVVEDVVYEVEMEEPEEEVAEEIFTIVEEQAEPVGGIQTFYTFVNENLRYPEAARRMGIQGKVFLQFVVEKDGSLTNIVVAKGIGGGCDEEAIRVISMAPDWKPGKQRGRPVRVMRIFPIHFKLAAG